MRKVDFRTLQTELAQSFEHLGFVRGDPEKKAVRLEHREYRAMKEQKSALQKEIDTLKSELASVKQVREQYKQERQHLKDSGTAKQSDYQELKKQYTELEQQAKLDKLTLANLEKAIKPLEKFVYSDSDLQTLEFTADTLQYHEDFKANLNAEIETPLKNLMSEVFEDEQVKVAMKLHAPYGLVASTTKKATEQIQELKQQNQHLIRVNTNLKTELNTTQSENQQLKNDLNALQSIKNAPDVQTYQPTPKKLSEAIKSVSKQQSLINWQTQTIETLKNLAEKSECGFLDKAVYVDWENEYLTTDHREILELRGHKFERLATKNDVQKFISTHEIAEIDDPLSVQLKPLERIIKSFSSVADFVEKVLEKFTSMEKTISEQANEITGLHNKIEQWADYADHLEQQLNENEHSNDNQWER
jgi:chromosome segregation ATPase